MRVKYSRKQFSFSDGSFPGQHTGRKESHARQSLYHVLSSNGEVLRNSWEIFDFAFAETVCDYYTDTTF